MSRFLRSLPVLPEEAEVGDGRREERWDGTGKMGFILGDEIIGNLLGDLNSDYLGIYI